MDSTLATTTLVILTASLLAGDPVEAVDHNDPNAVNSIFSDVPISPADLYDFFGFPGTFARTLATNEVTTLEAPGGHRILAFVGGRDDAFFNDLPGFFRSINYGPQFYEAPRAQAEAWPTTEEFLGRCPYLAAPC